MFCGIVGFTGLNYQSAPILLKGLEKLEYRGYDSAGIFVADQALGTDQLVKEKGRVAQLEALVDTKNVTGTSGIAHTRWATHGVPSINNAHPHLSADGRFYLVHNGVIENYLELKQEYLSDVTFHSDTDTEVAVQLIGKFVDDGMTTFDALKKLTSLLDVNSAYGFLLMDRNEPERMYVAKQKSPLLIGVGEDFNVVTSDAVAMLDQTHDFIELHDGEIAIIDPDNVRLFDTDGVETSREPFHLDIDASETDKGTYPFYMLKEIDEQPIVIRHLIEKYLDSEGGVHVGQAILDDIKAADRLYIVAAGTSYHAGLVGQRLFEQWAGIPTEVHVSSEFAYEQPLLSEKPFFIFLTQSGETADSREVLQNVNAQAILAYAVSDRDALGFDLEQDLSKIAVGIQGIVDDKETLQRVANEMLVESRNAFFIGRGVDSTVSLEAALKLKEISYVKAEGFAAGELKHGTLALIEEGTPVIALITQSKTAGLVRGNLAETQARGSRAYTIVTENLAKEGDDYILPNVNELLSPLLSVVPTQLLAYYTSLGRGLDVDRPRNLAKSVTVQ